MNFSKETTAEAVKKVIATVYGVEVGALKSETRFDTDLGGDSLMKIEVVMGIEEALNVEISDEDAEKINTVGEAVENVRSIVGEKNAMN